MKKGDTLYRAWYDSKRGVTWEELTVLRCGPKSCVAVGKTGKDVFTLNPHKVEAGIERYGISATREQALAYHIRHPEEMIEWRVRDIKKETENVAQGRRDIRALKAEIAALRQDKRR